MRLRIRPDVRDHPFLYDGTSNVIVGFFDRSEWSQDYGHHVLFQHFKARRGIIAPQDY